MVITDLDAPWPDLLTAVDGALARQTADAFIERIAEPTWRCSWLTSSGGVQVYVEAQDHAPVDPFDAAIPEPVLVVTRVARELGRGEALTDEAARASLVAAGENLYLRPCTRLHPDGSRKPVLAMTHTLYLATLDAPELEGVLAEAREVTTTEAQLV